MSFARQLKGVAAIVAATAMTFSVAACGGSGSQSSTDDATSITIAKPDGALGSENDNPFIADSSAVKMGYINGVYEPLGVVDLVDPSRDVKPWLASKIEWSEDYKSVTFTARDGVTWSDGKKFSADDIAYTFKMFMDVPGLDVQNLGITGVQEDGSTVTLNFKESMYTKQDKVLHKLIVPKHIWEGVKDPKTFKNEDMVGTGPYTKKQYTSESVVLTARKDYWGGEVAAKTLYFVSYNDNTALANAMANGDADWAQAFIPSVKKTFLDKDKEHNHFYAADVLNADVLFLNTTQKPFNDVTFRKALNMVVDREQHSKIAREGAIPVLTSVTGLPSPSGDEFIADAYKDKDYKVDVAGAKKLLTDAGYTYQGDTLMDPEGNAVTFQISVPQGWTDYVTGISLIADSASKIGVKANVKTPDADSWTEDLANGKFGAALHWTDSAATPYDYYSDIMDGRWYKKIGESAQYNFGRYQNDAATAALDTYATTTDDASRTAALNEIEKIFVDDVPAIPVGTRPFFSAYNTRKFTGWPDEKDPYVVPDLTQPTASYIYTQLKAVK